MCLKRNLKGLSWQLTNILGLGVPSGGGVGVGLAGVWRTWFGALWEWKWQKLIIFMKIISTQCTACFSMKIELHSETYHHTLKNI